MKKAMVFNLKEFDTLIDDEWDEWENKLEEEGKEVGNFHEKWEEFFGVVIGKKFDMVVEHIIVDNLSRMVAVVFE